MSYTGDLARMTPMGFFFPSLVSLGIFSNIFRVRLAFRKLGVSFPVSFLDSFPTVVFISVNVFL